MSELTNKPLNHKVSYSLTFKRNLGNFENVDIHVGLEVEGQGNPTPNLEKSRQWVEDQLAIAVQEVTEALKGN